MFQQYCKNSNLLKIAAHISFSRLCLLGYVLLVPSTGYRAVHARILYFLDMTLLPVKICFVCPFKSAFRNIGILKLIY